jgi:3'-5' exoribonuclease
LREDYELGLVAALVHDIGKILTLTPQMTLTSLGSCVEHEKLTGEVLGSGLRHFNGDWPEGAKKLRYLLGWKLQRALPHYNMAELVACGDRVSAGLDMERKKAEIDRP